MKIKNQPRELKFGTHINFSVHMKISVKFVSYQLSSVVSSCQLLITVDENENQPRELKLSTPINFYQLLSAFISCWQLMPADMNKELTGIFMYTLKLILLPNFSSLGWFSFSSTTVSCCQLLTAVDCWWQLIWKKNYWNFFVHTKVNTCAEFQLSRLIFIFISCQQLL